MDPEIQKAIDELKTRHQALVEISDKHLNALNARVTELEGKLSTVPSSEPAFCPIPGVLNPPDKASDDA